MCYVRLCVWLSNLYENRIWRHQQYKYLYYKPTQLNCGKCHHADVLSQNPSLLKVTLQNHSSLELCTRTNYYTRNCMMQHARTCMSSVCEGNFKFTFLFVVKDEDAQCNKKRPYKTSKIATFVSDNNVLTINPTDTCYVSWTLPTEAYVLYRLEPSILEYAITETSNITAMK
jgi:hypothetical protein